MAYRVKLLIGWYRIELVNKYDNIRQTETSDVKEVWRKGYVCSNCYSEEIQKGFVENVKSELNLGEWVGLHFV